MFGGRSVIVVVALALSAAACSPTQATHDRPISQTAASNPSPATPAASVASKESHEPRWPTIPHDARVLPQSIWFVDPQIGFGSTRRCSRAYDSGRFFRVKCTLLAFRSVDGGETWRPTDKAGHFTHHHRQKRALAEIDYPSDVYFADERNGWVYGGATYRTEDGGATWRIERGLPTTAQTVTGESGLVWAVTKACDWDGCDSRLWIFDLVTGKWSASPAQPSCFGSLAVVDGGTAFMSCADVSVTTDGGETWTTRQSPCEPVPGADHGSDISARSPSEVWLICSDEGSTGGQGLTLFHSLDGGRSWVVTSEDHECPCQPDRLGNPPIGGFQDDLLVTPDGDLFLSRTKFGSVYRSTDGTNWVPVLRNVDFSFSVVAVDDLHLWARTGDDCCLLRTSDGGETWDVTALGSGISKKYRRSLERADV